MNMTISVYWLIPIAFFVIWLVTRNMGDGPSVWMIVAGLSILAAMVSAAWMVLSRIM
jgi:hypothetical protein